MPEVTILTEQELRDAVSLNTEAVDIVEQAFAALAKGGVVMPPILSMAIEDKNAELDVKTAYVPGLDAFAVKASGGFFNNPAKGLPSLSGLMVLLDADTGLVKSVLLDNGYLTDLRTAAAGAVVARHLAPKVINTVAIIGTGTQAELQLKALALVRDFKQVRVWGRNPHNAEQYAQRIGQELGLMVDPCADAEACVKQSDIVITTTPSRTPLVQADWLQAGQHITAMGSDAHEKTELDPQVLKRADRFVCDRKSQSVALGELRPAIAAGIVDENFPADELGEIIIGDKPGRTSEQEITVCDLTGTGIQDTAIANFAYAACMAQGSGTKINT